MAQPQKSIKRNYIFNTLAQLITMLAPIVVIPYVSRVLLPEGVGIASYSNSIVSYFTLFAALGTATYGQRTIGYSQSNKEERSKCFWEIFTLRLTTSLITLLAYVIYTIFINENRLIYSLLAINIISVIFDITWFYQGLEEFGKISLIGICCKVLYVVSIFIFVKKFDDLTKYIFLTSLFALLPNIIMWLPLHKFICKPTGVNPFADIKTVLQMFIPTLAIQVYAVLDKSMIKWITGSYSENGYYERAENMAKMALMVITSLGTVMTPRISRQFKEGNMTAVKNYVYKSYRFTWFLGIPIMIGLVTVASAFVPIFLGEAFNGSIILLQIFSLLVVIIGLNNVTAMQYLVPVGKQNIFTINVIIGACVNVVLNLLLIKRMGALGACIASVVAELCVTASAFISIFIMKQYSLKPVFLSSIKYWISGIIMGGIIIAVKYFLSLTVWALFLLIAIGICVYFILLLLLRDELLLDVLSKVLIKIKSIGNLKDSNNDQAFSTEDINHCFLDELNDSNVIKEKTDQSEDDETSHNNLT